MMGMHFKPGVAHNFMLHRPQGANREFLVITKGDIDTWGISVAPFFHQIFSPVSNPYSPMTRFFLTAVS